MQGALGFTGIVWIASAGAAKARDAQPYSEAGAALCRESFVLPDPHEDTEAGVGSADLR